MSAERIKSRGPLDMNYELVHGGFALRFLLNRRMNAKQSPGTLDCNFGAWWPRVVCNHRPGG